MRVLLDANVVIRMLLRSENPARAVDIILDVGLRQAITLLVPSELRREVMTKIQGKRYLSDRILPDEAIEFFHQVAQRGVNMPTRAASPRPLSRDPKDDYLLAYAESGRANYLVTYDEDLLVLDGQFPFRIIRPPEFLGILRERGFV